ncbi:hypothetical protein K438DRAFT_1937206 [Mycena galopus ATCC 62051]|nr:hypothetical protein K438DRAFT_1937206 [Mycena galopus ATCC 62051]
MASSDEKSADGRDDILDSPTSDSFHPATPMHMYPFSSTSQTVRLKRIQVKNACTKCQKSCKKCDQARPCLRCVKYGFGPEECVDSQRKERKKGAKRGPYKKRDGKGNSIAQSKDPTSHEFQVDLSSSPSGSHTSAATGSMPGGYSPGFHPFPPGYKPGDPVYYHPQVYFAPPPNSVQESEGSMYPSAPQFFPATFPTAYAHPYPPYVAYARPNAHIQPPAPVGDGRDYRSEDSKN